MTRIEAFEWIILDNLKAGWYFGTSLDQPDAERVMGDLVRRGLAGDGQITEAGKAWLAEHGGAT